MTETNRSSYEQRFFEILPGFMIWVLLLAPFWAGRTIPLIMADFLVLLSIYWLYRGVLTTVGTVIGYERYRRARKQDWLQKCLELQKEDLPDPQSLPVEQFLPKHLIVIPQTYPKYDVLKTTLEGLSKQNYPQDMIYIAVSLEERSLVKMEPGSAEEIENQLRQDFPDISKRLMFFTHPEGMVGEAIGAAANRTWGAKNAVAALEERGEIISDFLITSPDEDVIFHPQYLAAATYQYLINPKRKQRFYQTAVYTFNNNYWQVPILIRVLSISLTIPILSSSVIEKHKRETYSCYTLALDVMVAVDYWDTSIGIDDTTFYWRPYFYFQGDWECEVFFIPLSADAIYNPDYIRNHRDQYKQYVRWGWGVITFPIGFRGLLRHNEIPLWQRIGKMWHLFEVFVFFKVLAYIITFALPLLLLLNPDYNELVIWYSIPDTISKIMGITTIFLIPATLYKVLLAPPKPTEMSWAKYVFFVILETPMTLVNILTFSFLPFIEASTRMMFGQKANKTVSWSQKHR